MLADPVRWRILFASSAAGELCVGDLALALEVTEDQVVVRAEDAAPDRAGQLPQRRSAGLLSAVARVPATSCWSTACASCSPLPCRGATMRVLDAIGRALAVAGQ